MPGVHDSDRRWAWLGLGMGRLENQDGSEDGREECGQRREVD